MNYLLFKHTLMKPHMHHSFSPGKSNCLDSITNTQNDHKIKEVWSKHNFNNDKVKIETINLNHIKTTWGAETGTKEPGEVAELVSDIKKENVESTENAAENSQTNDQGDQEDKEGTTSPSHHARRPPNAFLIFCKKHRPIVRQRYPTTENRGVTKILGEWWALLNIVEKQPYNDLAKEYKDAFLSANPGFRWYKLPAPPLRTLSTRPTTISKPPIPVSSASLTCLSEFTPGKLADESQLGGLTSLMNNFIGVQNSINNSFYKIEDNNNEPIDFKKDQTSISDLDVPEGCQSPDEFIKTEIPPRPIKKRVFEQFVEEEKKCPNDVFRESNENITQQDLLNKVVDDIFSFDSDGQKEQRKSDRMCKGKRYERFMVEGKLLGSKRENKLTQNYKLNRGPLKVEQETITSKSQEPPKFDLETTIKRLAERTNVKLDFEAEDFKPKSERVRTNSETSEPSASKSQSVSFNLDLRIDHLPSLSYDNFLIRKKESKKRKIKIKTESLEQRSKVPRLGKSESHLVGSQKRKNKNSITHLNKTENAELGGNNALLGLATLALVAASTEKIDENTFAV